MASRAFVGSFLLVLLSRLAIAPAALNLDNVNFAFAIEHFDPWMHQPQPPGYPFFVAEARLVNNFFDDPESTFLFVSIVITWLSVVMAFVLARRLFGTAAAWLSALLLTFNPTLWSSGLDSPLRPHLTLFSLIVAYLCWRMWNGETRLGLWSALVLGIAGGFRPDLLVFLFPLWCVSMWKSGNPRSVWIRGVGIIFGLTVVWLSASAYAVGGMDRYTLLMWVYSFSAMKESASVLLSTSGLDWLYQIICMVGWNGAGVLSWAWILPLWLYARRRQRRTGPAAIFIAMWIVPGMIAQALVHVAAPGHTLFSVAAFCVIGGHVISSACEGLSQRFGSKLEIGTAGIVVVLSTLIFFNVISLPSASPAQIMYKTLLVAIHQTTFEELRSANQLSESSVRDLKDLVRGNRPTVIVSTLGSSQHFRFLNSRVASYYVDDRDFWVVVDEENPPRASRIHGKDLLEIRYGAIVKVPVPKGGRIIWLMDPSSPFRHAVSKAVSLNQVGNLFHTDLASNLSDFRVKNFEFVVEH